MASRHRDGGAGDANCGAIGTNYTSYRQPGPRIASLIVKALGDARTVLNVGAGAAAGASVALVRLPRDFYHLNSWGHRAKK